MSRAPSDELALLTRSLESDRIHSAYLLSGRGDRPREAAQEFARGVVCTGAHPRPCESCGDCQRSTTREEIAIDGTGKKGPLLRHVGDHADLLWVERGANDTRVRIGQVRFLQNALRLRPAGSDRRVAVIADAEWLNEEAQNALLGLLEEPPPRTTLVLVAATSAGMRATVRSRCQKVAFRPEANDPLDDPDNIEIAERLSRIGQTSVPDVLDWAEDYRGARAPAAAAVQHLLLLGLASLRRSVGGRLSTEGSDTGTAYRPALDAFRTLGDCRKTLVQRNANPQMVAERALLALREAERR